MNKKEFPVDISIVFPTMNEGDSVTRVLDEIVASLEKIGRSYEIIAINTPSDNSSHDTHKVYADKYENFTAIELSHQRKAGNGKAIQYMLGFERARGKYIIHLDSDGQDNPADLPLFIEELEKGTDLVSGFKQNRKDGKFYMFQSKIGNTITRLLTGVEIHDMNCGFKGYQNHVAKSLNIRGRWYRFIPAMAASKGYTVEEVPIENRKREWGKTNFSFRNRLEGGLFDMGTVILNNNFSENPMYFFGWLAIAIFALASLTLFGSFFINDLYTQIVVGMFAMSLFIIGSFALLLSILNEFRRATDFVEGKEFGIREIYTGK